MPPGVFPSCSPGVGGRGRAANGLVRVAGVSHAGAMAAVVAPLSKGSTPGVTAPERLDEAFAATPRAAFLPVEVRDRWREDRPLPLVHGMTNSQPSTVREMLRLLDVPAPEAGARVLDVGSGSGWTTALLAHLVGSRGSVLGLEIEPDLVAFGRANLASSGCRASDRASEGVMGRARIEPAAAGILGAPDRAPFDRILVSAMAMTLPEELVAQLADGGVLVAPVDGRMVRVRRGSGSSAVERFGGYRFVPLR